MIVTVKLLHTAEPRHVRQRAARSRTHHERRNFSIRIEQTLHAVDAAITLTNHAGAAPALRQRQGDVRTGLTGDRSLQKKDVRHGQRRFHSGGIGADEHRRRKPRLHPRHQQIQRPVWRDAHRKMHHSAEGVARRTAQLSERSGIDAQTRIARRIRSDELKQMSGSRLMCRHDVTPVLRIQRRGRCDQQQEEHEDSTGLETDGEGNARTLRRNTPNAGHLHLPNSVGTRLPPQSEAASEVYPSLQRMRSRNMLSTCRNPIA